MSEAGMISVRRIRGEESGAEGGREAGIRSLPVDHVVGQFG